MIENVNNRPTSGESEKECVILGCWDHEKTPYVIKDLEVSVSQVEKKCKKLLQQLLFFKKYSDQLKTLNFETCVNDVKSKTPKKLKNQRYVSGSLPDVTVRRRILNSQQLEEIFQEKFKEKLRAINEELTLAADKIGLKEKMIFFPTERYLKSLNESVKCEMKDSLPRIREDFIKMNFIRTTAKSDPMISTKTVDSEFSKITQNELELYQKLSRMSLSKSRKPLGKSKLRKSVLSPAGRPAIKFRKLRKRILKRKVKRQNPLQDSSQSQKESDRSGTKNNINKSKTKEISKISKKHLKVSKEKKKKKFPFHNNKNFKIYKNNLSRSDSTVLTNENSSQALSEKRSPLKEEKSYLEIERMCNSLMEAIHINDGTKECEQQRPTTTDGKANIRPLLMKRPIPFTSCTSTSKSFNIGMNIQQFLSLKKYKKIHQKPSSPVLAKNSENKHGQQAERKYCHLNNENQNWKPESKYNVTATYPWNAEMTNSADFHKQEVSHLEHKENFWISNVTGSSNPGRKVRSKFTGNSPQGYVEYHKSTTRRYTNGQESMIKSESKSAYAVGSKIMVSDCRKTDFYKMEENHCGNACGDCEKSTKLRSEWNKVYDTFINLSRRYNSLKEEITCNKLTPSELKALEDEIDYAVEKYKEFLMFYSKFLHLKNELKSLKTACETGVFTPVTSFSSNCQKVLCFRPTSSMAFKKALRQVQILQDNIRRLDNY